MRKREWMQSEDAYPNDKAIAERDQRFFNDKDNIVEYLKAAKDAVQVTTVARDLKMDKGRPTSIATKFPKTLATWMEPRSKGRIIMIDLVPALRRYHR